eukprot:3077371-Prymnesium_polylepis.1
MADDDGEYGDEDFEDYDGAYALPALASPLCRCHACAHCPRLPLTRSQRNLRRTSPRTISRHHSRRRG